MKKVPSTAPSLPSSPDRLIRAKYFSTHRQSLFSSLSYPICSSVSGIPLALSHI